MAAKDQKLFCGFTFANARWQVIKPIQEPVIRHRRWVIVSERETWGLLKVPSITCDSISRVWRGVHSLMEAYSLLMGLQGKLAGGYHYYNGFLYLLAEHLAEL